MESMISRKEAKHAEETIDLKALPMPKLTIKGPQKERQQWQLPNSIDSTSNKLHIRIPKAQIQGNQRCIQQKQRQI